MNEVDAAVYTILAGGTALVALLADGTAGIHNLIAPYNTDVPHVVFGMLGGQEKNVCPGGRFKRFQYLAKGVSEVSFVEAGSVDAACDALLHKASLSVSGWSAIKCWRRSDVKYVEHTQSGTKVYHVGGIYEIDIGDP